MPSSSEEDEDEISIGSTGFFFLPAERSLAEDFFAKPYFAGRRVGSGLLGATWPLLSEAALVKEVMLLDMMLREKRMKMRGR